MTQGSTNFPQPSCSLLLQMFLVEGARHEAMLQGSDNLSTCEVVAGQTPLLAVAGAPGGARVMLPFPNRAASLPLRWAVSAAKATAVALLSACVCPVGCLPVPYAMVAAGKAMLLGVWTCCGTRKPPDIQNVMHPRGAPAPPAPAQDTLSCITGNVAIWFLHRTYHVGTWGTNTAETCEPPPRSASHFP